jgi:hypothetical protein
MNKQNELIRKARQGSAFIAPDNQAILASITSGAGGALVALPSGWEDVGWTSGDGAQFGRSVDSSDVTSWGSVEPTRRDILRDVTTVAVTMQETKKETLELYTGATIPATNAAAATTGELIISKPAQPAAKFNRLLVMAVDENSDGEIYLARFFPRVSVTEYGEQAFGEGDDPIGYNVTFTAYKDSTAGYSERWYFGGPGWLALLTEMGISQSS